MGAPFYYGIAEPLYFFFTCRFSEALSGAIREVGYKVPVLVCLRMKGYSASVVGFLPRAEFIVVNGRVVERVSPEDLKPLLVHEGVHIAEKHNLKHVFLAVFLIGLTPLFIHCVLIWLVWLAFVVTTVTLYARMHETSAAKIASSIVGSERYGRSMRIVDEITKRERGLLTSIWYRLTHPE